jgi:hypothetical protein
MEINETKEGFVDRWCRYGHTDEFRRQEQIKNDKLVMLSLNYVSSRGIFFGIILHAPQVGSKCGVSIGISDV